MIAIFLPEFRKDSHFSFEIKNTLSDLDSEIEIVYIKRNVNPLQQQQMLFAIHVANVVIVDCTIPSDKSDGGVYPALTAQINCLNHIVVVSENVLPLNIKPYRWVAPQEDGQLFSTSCILDKLPETVAESIKEDTYDRFPAEEFLSNMEKFMPGMEKMIQASLEARTQKKSSATKVLISYRNSHKKEVDDFVHIIQSKDTQSIKLRESMGCMGEYEIKVLPPASLCGADEAHTPMRRWMLVGILEDHIREVDEVWVYESRDSNGCIDYTNSWWTIAEMVMVSYINNHSSKKIRIRVYNPINKKFYITTPEKYLITLTKNQNQRLARLLSNTRPDTMGPEMLNQVHQLSQIANFLKSELVPRALKEQMLNNLRDNFEKSVPNNLSEDERAEMIENMMSLYSDPDEIDKYVNDDVFKTSFWNNISYQTSTTTLCFQGDIIDVDSFMQIPMLELTDLEIKDFEAATKTEDRIISIRDNAYNVTKAHFNRYLWLATRMGKPTIGEISETPGLEIIPIYNLSQSNT